jgi:ubiquinone/menaquinone biosynthesis C-methylase UbiE
MIFLNYGSLIDPFFKDLREIIPQFADMKPGDKALDICCGTGAQVFVYQQGGIIASGVDLNPGMLNLALRKARSGQTAISFYLADANKLPFVDHFFDFTSISFGLHDKDRETRYRIVSEMKRVTKQNGNIIFIDFTVPLPDNAYGLLARSVEWLVGGRHYQGFKDYLKRGGLEEIIWNQQLKINKRHRLKGGMATIIKANNA